MSIIAREAATAAYHLTIKDLPTSIRPRERLQTLGPQALSDDELLAIVARTGTASQNVVEMSRSVLTRFGGLRGLNQASWQEIAREPGMGSVKATELKAAFELGKRMLTLSPEELPQITGPQDVYALLRLDMQFLQQESVRVMLLNTKHRVQAVHEATLGTLNSSNVRVGEIFREAVRQQASAVVLVHNHPSGDPTPSADDVALTQKVVYCGEQLDIEVLDHVIIGQPGSSSPGWVSLRQRGLGFAGA